MSEAGTLGEGASFEFSDGLLSQSSMMSIQAQLSLCAVVLEHEQVSARAFRFR